MSEYSNKNQNNCFDPVERAREKAESRKRDEEGLASGLWTRDDLRRINGIFAQLKGIPNFSQYYKKEEKQIKPLYQEDPESYFTHYGDLYSLNKIFEIVHNYPIHNFSIVKLEWMLLAQQNLDEKRIIESNTDIPIIIMPIENQWVVVDGIHRLAKAKRNKQKKIAAKSISFEKLLTTKIS